MFFTAVVRRVGGLLKLENFLCPAIFNHLQPPPPFLLLLSGNYFLSFSFAYYLGREEREERASSDIAICNVLRRRDGQVTALLLINRCCWYKRGMILF